MRKLILTTAISAITASMTAPVFASSMTCNVNGGSNNGLVYTTSATSNGISVSAGATTNVYYVNNSLSSASNTSSPAYTLVVNGNWCIDTSSGAFEGNINYGSYKTQTNVTGFPVIDGRQTFGSVNQHFVGIGTWNNLPQPTLSFYYLNSSVNGGGASTQSESSSSCLNGKTSFFGKVCSAFSTATKDWEGLEFFFEFNDSTKYSFNGWLKGTDTSGSGLASNVTEIDWNIIGVDPPAIPVPASAWLFGSGLIGLAGAARRRNRNK